MSVVCSSGSHTKEKQRCLIVMEIGNESTDLPDQRGIKNQHLNQSYWSCSHRKDKKFVSDEAGG